MLPNKQNIYNSLSSAYRDTEGTILVVDGDVLDRCQGLLLAGSLSMLEDLL